MDVVCVRNLSKYYWVAGKKSRLLKPKGERLVAVDNVSLVIPEGEIVGLLGPNGAGKTTLIKMVCGLLRPDAGAGTVLGHDLLAHPERIRGLVSLVAPTADIGTDNNLTVRENLEFWASVYGVPRTDQKSRIDELLELVNLTDRQGFWPMRISAGMRQRLAIARSLLARNDLLLLDEPTIKLDPDSARDIRSFIRDVNQRHGVTILLTTHQMFEAEELCHRLLVMQSGRIVACGSPSEIKRAAGRLATVELTLSELSGATASALRKCAGVETATVNVDQNQISLTTTDIDATTAALLDLSHRSGLRLISMRSDEPTLDDAFHALTGETLSGPAIGAAKEVPGGP